MAFSVEGGFYHNGDRKMNHQIETHARFRQSRHRSPAQKNSRFSMPPVWKIGLGGSSGSLLAYGAYQKATRRICGASTSMCRISLSDLRQYSLHQSRGVRPRIQGIPINGRKSSATRIISRPGLYRYQISEKES